MLIRRSTLLVLFLLALPAVLGAQMGVPRPLVTRGLQDLPGRGGWHLYLGAAYAAGARPGHLAEAGKGDLTQIPALAFDFGIGRHAVIQVEWAVAENLDREEGETRTEVGDPYIWTKVGWRMEKPKGPQLGMRIGFKVPSSSDTEGIGTDEPDLFGTFVLEQKFPRAVLDMNLGFGILGDPLKNSSQTDVITYGLALDLPVSKGSSLLMEVAGSVDPSSGGVQADLGEGRFGFRVPAAAGDFTGALRVGYRDASPDWGATFGYTWRKRKR